MRPSREEWAMGLALLTSQRSTCYRRSVGCVLLNNMGHVVATGYNGVATGQPHCNLAVAGETDLLNGAALTKRIYPNLCAGAKEPSGQGLDSCDAIHAEQNALLQCRDVQSIHACFVTTSPCVTCTKLLLNTGCSEIYFNEVYPQPRAKELWESAGLAWTHLDISDRGL